MSGFTAADVPDQSGRTIIVTGSNTGIGFEAARALAAKGARVLLACRSRDKAEAAMSRIAGDVSGTDVAFLPLDQADLASVRAAAEQASREPRLDVLLNNAGVMYPPLSHTAQGFELQFGVNHLATFALSALLLPKLAETPGARVVVTSSIAHRTGKTDWSDPRAERSFATGKRYCDSKLANLLFVAELDRRLRAASSPVAAIGCHPGVAATELMRHSRFAGIANAVFGRLLNTAAMGAWPALQAATDPAAKPGGYYGPTGFGEARGSSGEAKRSATAGDPDPSRRLWDLSVKLTGIDPGLPPA